MLSPYRFASLGSTLTLLCSLSCIGCGGDDEPAGAHVHDGGAAHVHDAGTDAQAGDTVPCDDQYKPFHAGMQTTAGNLTVKLLSVDPDPVRQLQDNHWVLEVEGADGKPVANAAIVEADTWMDVHNHGGRWNPDIAPGSAPGQFDLTKVDFKMPGPWRLRFGVKVGSDPTIQRSTFQICVE